jgi:hypothetical protein
MKQEVRNFSRNLSNCWGIVQRCSFKLGNELVNIFRNASIGTTVIGTKVLFLVPITCVVLWHVSMNISVSVKISDEFKNNHSLNVKTIIYFPYIRLVKTMMFNIYHLWYTLFFPLHRKIPLINNYSPKPRWLSVNKNRDEVEVFIHDNHRAWARIPQQDVPNPSTRDYVTRLRANSESNRSAK